MSADPGNGSGVPDGQDGAYPGWNFDIRPIHPAHSAKGRRGREWKEREDVGAGEGRTWDEVGHIHTDHPQWYVILCQTW